MAVQIFEGNTELTFKPKIALLASRFHHLIVQSLIDGAIRGLTSHGISEESIHVLHVPGAFELPLLAQRVAPRYDGCIALGAIIRGDTPHFDFVAGECAAGLRQVSLAMNKPIMFGVLTTDTLEQAWERAGIDAGNKGYDAALGLIEMLSLFHRIQ